MTKSKLKYWLLGLFCSATMLLYAEGEGWAEDKCPAPWFTGTLLEPLTWVPENNAIIIQPYVATTCQVGEYNSHWHSESEPSFWNVSSLVLCVFGINDWLDFEMSPVVTYQETENASSFNVADSVAGFDFQLYRGPEHGDVPYASILLSLLETIPVGKYKNLNPAKLETDSTGGGAWVTSPSLTFYGQFNVYDCHFLSASTSVTANVAAPVSVRGLNTYGGGSDTEGTVYPGTRIVTLLSFEYTLTQNWVLALDSSYIHGCRTRFSGTSLLPVGNPSFDKITFAPAIEYNFNENLGIIAGAWFSAWGRNTSNFRGAIISLAYTIT